MGFSKMKFEVSPELLRNAGVLIGIAIALFSVSLIGVGLMLHMNLKLLFFWFFKSTIGSKFGILNVLRRTTGLLVVSLGLCVAFATSVWNIGGEGQIMWGGLMTVGVCFALASLPLAAVAPAAFIVAFIAGGAWGLIAGVLKAKWEVNEIVSTMMLNFVAMAAMIEIAGGPWRNPILLVAITKDIARHLWFPTLIAPLDSTFIVALALIPVVHILMNKTLLGYEMRVVGFNRKAAAYAGINISRVVNLCMFLSGGLCGLAGALLVFGRFHHAEVGMTGLFGFYAIVSTLLGRCQPKLMFPTSLLIAIILTGSEALRILGVPGRFTDILMGILFIVGVLPEIFARRR